MKSDHLSRLSWLVDELQLLTADKRSLEKVYKTTMTGKHYRFGFGELDANTCKVVNVVELPESLAKVVADNMIPYLDQKIADIEKEIDSL